MENNGDDIKDPEPDIEIIPQQSTDIQDCMDVKEEDDIYLLDKTSPEKIVFDLTVSLKTRLAAIDKCNDGHEMLDILNRIGMMYMFSESRVIEKYLFEIVHSTRLDPFLKLIAAKNLKEYSIKGYDCFEYLILSDIEFPIVSRVECILLLFEDINYQEKGFKHLDNFINDQKVDCNYRYKTLINNDKKVGNYITKLLENFLDNKQNLNTYKILACQYILVNEYQELTQKSQNILIEILDTSSVSYNVRADACDVVLQYGEDEYKKVAAMVLDNLSKDGKRQVITIYDNAQNAHSKSIVESVEKILGEIAETIQQTITFDLAKEEFLKFVDENKYSEEIKSDLLSCLNRIELDRARYGKVSMTLSTVFIKIWLYIKSHEYTIVLKERLVEELLGCIGGICSTGFVDRMVNSLSGITEFSLRISFGDQIIANMGAKLNKEIMKLEDEKIRDIILEEMTIPSQFYHLRPHFLQFFRENISKIRENMYQDFKDDITDTDFDMYTRRAVLKYQGDLA